MAIPLRYLEQAVWKLTAGGQGYRRRHVRQAARSDSLPLKVASPVSTDRQKVMLCLARRVLMGYPVLEPSPPVWRDGNDSLKASAARLITMYSASTSLAASQGGVALAGSTRIRRRPVHIPLAPPSVAGVLFAANR